MGVLEERFALALHTTARVWRQVLDKRMKDLGISQSGWMAITSVARSRVPMSQIELANELGVEGASMVALLDRLEKSGLIVREPSSSDRRVKLVMLTEEGNALYLQVRNKVTTFRNELLRDIEPKKLLAAAELLESLQQMLESPT
jgi:MarR family transcriptional regulator for hemolysin